MGRLRTAPLLLVLATLAASSPSPAEEPVHRLQAPRRAGDGAGPLDWVIDKVESGRDEWSGERLNDEVNARLQEIASFLKGRAGAAELAALFAEGFRGAPALPAEETPVLETEDFQAFRGLASGGEIALLDAGAWSETLIALRGAFERVAKAKFKVFQVEQQPAPSLLIATRALLEVDGDAAGGGFLQLRAVWDLSWLEVEGAWRIAGIGLVSSERVLARRRAFREVTEEALGANASYREQLAFGVEHWRTRLDAASGIDIYGHQGIAVGDYDGDGWEDFYVPQPAGLPNRLFRNLGGGRFEDATQAAGVAVLDVTGGALFVDLDNDGDLDLVMATSLEALLFENDGRGRFERRVGSGLESAARRSASLMGAAAADYDLDGDLDLYLFSYIFWAGAGSKLHSSYPYPYHDARNGAPNFLFQNLGGLRFRDVTEASGMDDDNRRFSLAASWADFDDDGDPDLYVANDFGKNNLYRNDSGRFRDVAVELGVDDVGNGMSVAWEDYDNDGRLDLYVGNMWSSAGSRIASQPQFGGAALRRTYQRMARGNSLFRNLGGRFEDVTERSGAGFGRWSWSSLFADVDADGHEDLYVLNGFITNELEDDL